MHTDTDRYTDTDTDIDTDTHTPNSPAKVVADEGLASNDETADSSCSNF